ncbi:MAG TPA: A/G-specific adenine glycosylase [Verrucomicrobiae bacterium]|nr:A/G-specific adenine glycosylase [Verrucomicrobiae bacterium]
MNSKPKTKNSKLVAALLDWFAANARDLPWRRTRDPYAIWVSEIMLQQTQVKTVIPFWNRWMRELPTIEAAAKAPSAKIHKLWEGLGYYTRVRNLQKAAQQIVAQQTSRRRRGDESQTKSKLETPHVVSYKFPETYDEVLALPGIGRYTAGAICSIAFNQPRPILDGNVIRVLTRIFGIGQNPKKRETNQLLWQIAEELVCRAKDAKETKKKFPSQTSRPSRDNSCSHLNQSLMELGALICTPRSPQCLICPVKKLCVAFKENRTDELPNLGKRQVATARTFFAFVIERDGKFLVRQRPVGIVNAHLWEFPNFETNGENKNAKEIFDSAFDFKALEFQQLCTVKHSITRYRITLEAFLVQLPKRLKTFDGIWLPRARFDSLAFTAAHKKLASFAKNCILSDR